MPHIISAEALLTLVTLCLLQGHSRNFRTRSCTIQRRWSLLASPWICLESLINFDTISLPRANITYAPASILDCLCI